MKNSNQNQKQPNLLEGFHFLQLYVYKIRKERGECGIKNGNIIDNIRCFFCFLVILFIKTIRLESIKKSHWKIKLVHYVNQILIWHTMLDTYILVFSFFYWKLFFIDDSFVHIKIFGKLLSKLLSSSKYLTFFHFFFFHFI